MTADVWTAKSRGITPVPGVVFRVSRKTSLPRRSSPTVDSLSRKTRETVGRSCRSAAPFPAFQFRPAMLVDPPSSEPLLVVVLIIYFYLLQYLISKYKSILISPAPLALKIRVYPCPPYVRLVKALHLHGFS